MITELTKLLIEQYEHEKKIGKKEYIKISVQDFYKGLIKILKEAEHDSTTNI